ncbi:hypothetical protein AAHA92_15279 [Salvia divinorum]|uniref:DDE Tnp4 domain-containing protein n=1 Tax=Salvia divinorum TaxID=28513 RepID=A0ABD1HI76_SALDI
MDRKTFSHLRYLLIEHGGLCPGRIGSLVLTFGGREPLFSHYVNKVLGVILSLHSVLLAKPTPVADDCDDTHWKWFMGCLGALNCTHIPMLVSNTNKPRYQTRKRQIAANTLVVCDRNMQFVYVLPGWEGSAGDSRGLRDAVLQVNGLKVPKEAELDDAHYEAFLEDEVIATEFVEFVEPTTEWTQLRENNATDMWMNR